LRTKNKWRTSKYYPKIRLEIKFAEKVYDTSLLIKVFIISKHNTLEEKKESEVRKRLSKIQ